MNASKISIRPEIPHINEVPNKTETELFQNVTLRPILKLQHELFLAYFENYVNQRKIAFETKDLIQKEAIIEQLFKSDARFKAELKGLVVGHFTVEEFSTYQAIAHECNRRIWTMIKQRLCSVLIAG